jgi:hypothetical protein
VLKEANMFKVTHSEALALTVYGVDLSNEGMISLALNAYNELTDPAQTILSNEKLLLDNLQARINGLKQEASDQATIEAVVVQINALSEKITLADKTAVEALRVAYDLLTADQKALVTNIDKLIVAETKIMELEENAAYESLKLEIEVKLAAYESMVQADLTTQELITAANEAKAAIVLDGLTEADKEAFQTRINAADVLVTEAQTILDEQVEINEAVEEFKSLVSDALSLKVETVGIGHKDAVVGALDLYNKLLEPVQARLQEEKTLLDDLLTEIRKQEADNRDAADTVTALINSLPEIEVLTLDNKEAVEGARIAYDNLTDTQKGLISAADVAKLSAAEGQILVLIADKEASDKASEFKETHKDALALTVETVTIDNKIIVDLALTAFVELGPEVQARLGEGEKDLLESLKQKILGLEQQAAEDQAAAEIVGKLISALPSVEDLVLSDKKDVLAARTAYDALMEAQQKLVTKLELLTTIEAQMAVLEKTVDLVGHEVIDGNYVVNRNYVDNSIKNDDIGSVALWIGDTEVTNDFDITFYASKDGQVITSFDVSNGGTTFKAYMKAKAKEGKDYYDVEVDVFFKYGSVTIGNNDNYYTIEDALDQANSGTIFVKHNTSFADKEVAELIYGGTEFTINKGVTVLLPYSDALSEKLDDTPSAASGPITRNKAYVEVNVPSGINLNIKGALNVNGMRATHGTRISGHVTGTNYSQLYLAEDSEITVESSGILSVMGFIYGEGQVEALSGSTVNDNLFNQGFRGGSATLNVQSDVFPFDQFTINNIETELVINSGANYIAKTLIYVSSKYNKGDLKLVGTDDKSLIQLTSGQLIKTYEVNSGVVTMDFHGDASINVSSINVAGITANSKGKDMPFDGTWRFNVATGNSINIDSWMVLLPGGQMNIEEGANVTVTEKGRLGVFDPYEHLDDYNTYPVTNIQNYYRVAPTFDYNANTSAKLTVNGTLNVEGGVAGRVHKGNNGQLTWGNNSYKTYDYKYVIGSAGSAKSNSRELTFWEEGDSTLAAVATPSTVVTKDKTVSTIVATVKDKDNKPIEGVQVTFEGGKGTWSAASGITDKNGKVIVTYTTSEEEEAGTVLTVTEKQKNKTTRVNLKVMASGGGGCPFIYSYDGETYHFEHEPVPYSVSKSFEDTTYGTLCNLKSVDGKYQVRITEEMDTETFVNGFNLYAVDYKDNMGISQIFADIFGKPHTIKERILPLSFIDSKGNSKLEAITTKGSLISSDIDMLKQGEYVETYEATFNKPADAKVAKLMISAKANDIVDSFAKWFFDLLDGENNMWWIEKIINQPSHIATYVDALSMMNLKIQLWNGEEWIEQGELAVGSNLLEEFLIPLNLSQMEEEAETIKVRIKGGTGFFDIDQLSIDFTDDEIENIQKLEIDSALRNGIKEVKDILNDLDNDQRVKLQNGDTIDLYFNTIDLTEGLKRGFVVGFKGYFHTAYETKSNPVVDTWKGLSYDEIIEKAIAEQPEAEEILPALTWLSELTESVYGKSMEYKIEKFIVEQLLPWLNK